MSSPTSYLGIDVDVNAIKVVELKNENGRPRLVTYGYYDRLVDEVAADGRNADAGLGGLIRTVCQQARTTSTKVISALPSFSVFSSILNLPMMPKKEMAAAVEWEAKKVIPLPIDEMILDWKILAEATETVGEAETSPEPPLAANQKPIERGRLLRITPAKQPGRYVKILLTAAPKDLVKRYIGIFKTGGLNLLSLDTEAFALIRSLVGHDRSALMIVDIGSVVTNVLVIVNGVPLLNRSIDVGGLTITKAITDSLNISLSRAEQFKYDIGMNQNQAGQGNIPKTIELALTPIVDELKYSLSLYRNQGQRSIEKVILTGGSSLLLNLPPYLSQLLDLKVYRGDAWARVIYPEELKPVLDEIGPRFAVAVGLAMRNIL